MKKILVLLSFALLALQTITAQPKLMKESDQNKFQIIYGLNGGINNNSNPPDYVENTTVTLKDPTRTNYIFDGWYWDSGFIEKIENSTFTNKSATLKIYAKWTLDMTVDLTNFESEYMVEIIPAGHKVLLENFAGGIGSQNIHGYTIAKQEVTQALFLTVMNFNPSSFNEGETAKTRPVENVTWYDAVYFCNELTKRTMSQDDCCYTITNIEKNEKGNITYAIVTRDEEKKGFRLPTEAEWEMAARGGVKGGWEYKYAGSNNKTDDVAWYWNNSKKTTHNVGTKKANAAGLYDMSGNVWEWCENRYEEGSSRRVNCGGSWRHHNDYCSVTCRNGNRPDYAYYYLGFRVCRSL